MRARDNPFSTDRVLRIRYRLSKGNWAEFLGRLSQLHYRAAIVGPDGTGKTTLLEDLEPRLVSLGLTPRPLRLDDEHRRFEPAFEKEFFARLQPQDVILLDGAEQMSRWNWWRFRQRSLRGGGLVITSHRVGLLPTVLETRTTPELLEEIITELLDPAVEPQRVATQLLFTKHHGNLRNALRELYDTFACRPQ